MKTLIAVIAFNEAANLRKTIADLGLLRDRYDVVIVDNASWDETAAIGRESATPVLSHCVNTGGSFGTVMTYLRYAYENGYEIVCQFDGDGQHIAAELPSILEPIEKGEADYVIGSRFLEGKGFQSYFFRQIGIRLFSFLDSAVIGSRITDATSGFRAYGRDVMRFFALHYRHEIHDPNQLLLLSHFAGARIVEVPALMRERLHGVSEFNFSKSLSFPVKGMVNIIGCLLQRRRIKTELGHSDGN